MKEDFVSFDLAKKLKEKGFQQDYNIFGYKLIYSNNTTIKYISDIGAYDKEYFGENISCPTISQVLKWLREEKEIFMTINIGYCYESDEKPFPTNPKMEPILKGYYYGIWELDNLNGRNALSKYFESPEEAAIAGIEYVLDNLI
jgi:hypothetical protein